MNKPMSNLKRAAMYGYTMNYVNTLTRVKADKVARTMALRGIKHEIVEVDHCFRVVILP